MQDNSQKLVSIGMTTRNHGAFIQHSIDPLLAQTYKNIVLIILDGASEDNTEEICSIYAEKDARVRYIRSEVNGGFVKDFGNVLKEGTGEYFMWAADDDWWHATFVERMVDVLEKNSEFGVAMSNFGEHFSYKYDPANVGKIFRHNYTGMNNYQVFKELIRPKMNPIFFHGLYRRPLLVNLYSRYIPDCIDGFSIFQCEAALATKFYSVSDVLYSKYRNPISITERHGFIKKAYQTPMPRTKYLNKMLFWLLTSRNIPIYRKHLILMPWLKNFWSYRVVVANELKSSVLKNA